MELPHSPNRFHRLRRTLGRALRLAWWIASFQLLGHLRERRQWAANLTQIQQSPLFDKEWYLHRYPDVAFGNLDPAQHFLRFGASERRHPSFFFDSNWYLEQNPDVSNSGMNPLIHYLQFGKAEGRRIRQVMDKPLPATTTTDSPTDYAAWIRQYDTLSPADRIAIRSHIAELRSQPLISLLLPVSTITVAALTSTIQSVLDQLYPRWELCVADCVPDAEIQELLDQYRARDARITLVRCANSQDTAVLSNSALQLATGDYIGLLDPADQLAESALYMVAVEVTKARSADIIYSDEDQVTDDGRRHSPHFKPDWNLELFYSYDFVGHFAVYRRSLVCELGGFRPGFPGSHKYDLALRLLRHTVADNIRHIPFILCHVRRNPVADSTTQPHAAAGGAQRALRDHFDSCGEDVAVEPSAVPFCNRVIRRPPAQRPLVSLIILTKNGEKLLRACLSSILTRTSYGHYEILVVNNGSNEPTALDYLNTLRSSGIVTVIDDDRPFNFSALNNRAVDFAHGDVIGFVNNDMEVISPGWLDEITGQLCRPGIGAVGAKLYYPDNTIQHAGVVLGMCGIAGHGHRSYGRSELGYYGRLQLVQEVSCVTGACMFVKKELFVSMGGFDDTHLAVAYNDVDFCLRLRQAGYRIIWTPYAELYHLESVSRGPDTRGDNVDRARQETQYMEKAWGGYLSDPFYSPNLALDNESFGLAFPPRVVRPWRFIEDAQRNWDHGPSIEAAQRGWKQLGADRLAMVFESGRQLTFPTYDMPVVSFIVVLRNHAYLTVLTLESIKRYVEVPYELILVDNASTDETLTLLDRLENVRLVRNAENLGFAPACNQGSRVARSRLLCFLNNDALLQPNSVAPAVADLTNTRVGAVGGKILLANGLLQEAGAMIWQDGTAWGYGRNTTSTSAEYEFRRPVDYCSGVFLMTPRALFEDLHGFDEAFAPAYYEDTDYCMKVWQHGLEVVYEPSAVVRHFESASSGGNENAKQLIACNRDRFLQKWQDQLRRHYPGPPDCDVIRARISVNDSRLRVLYIDDSIPHCDLGAGFSRSYSIVRELAERYRLTCASTLVRLENREYRDLPREVELLDASASRRRLYDEYLPAADCVWVSKHTNMEELRARIEQGGLKGDLPIIYDAANLCAKAECRPRRELPTPSGKTRYGTVASEVVLARAASLVVTASKSGSHFLKKHGVPKPLVVSNYIPVQATEASFAARQNFVFVGYTRGADGLATDAIRHFCRKVWPRLYGLTGTRLLIAGREAGQLNLDDYAGIELLDRVNDLSDIWNSCRVFMAPTPCYEEIVLTVLEAASRGMPCVLSPHLARQLGWTNRIHALVGATVSQLVKCCYDLYRDQVLWEQIRSNALEFIGNNYDKAGFKCAVDSAVSLARIS